jgi:hypothetical protein
MKVQKFGLVHEWKIDNVKEITWISQNVDEHVACKKVTTQIKCEEFLTFPQSLNKSDTDRGDNSLIRTFTCLKVPQNCCKNINKYFIEQFIDSLIFLSTPSYFKVEGVNDWNTFISIRTSKGLMIREYTKIMHWILWM